MNIVVVDGGLGNQLFQLSFALYLKDRSKEPVQINAQNDAVRHRHGTPGLSAVAQALGIDFYDGPSIPYHIKAALALRSFGTRRLFSSWVGIHSHVKWSGTRVYSGYWQSFECLEPYYVQVADACRDVLHHPVTPACCIHVRLGDYAQPGIRRIYAQVAEPYYTAALQEIENAQGSTTSYCLVSNDVQAARKMFAGTKLFIPTPIENLDPVLSDFVTLAGARALVASNSTFCWWAALIAARSGALETIVYPATWFNQGYKHRQSPCYDRLSEITSHPLKSFPIQV